MYLYSTIMDNDKTIHLIKERTIAESDIYDCPAKIVQFMNNYFDVKHLPEEHIFELCFNDKYRMLGVFELSVGTASCSVCNTREIFQKALLANATQIALVHNHPSGYTTPSKEDISVTGKVKQAGELMGIGLIDHIIVGDDSYSFKEKSGLL